MIYTPNQPTGMQVPENLCIYWQSYGTCAKGDSCPFVHLDCIDYINGICYQEDCPLYHRELCKYFRAGSCSKGEDCRYAHEFCDDYLIGMCRFTAETCRFVHRDLCKYWSTKGFCNKPDCSFIHQDCEAFLQGCCEDEQCPFFHRVPCKYQEYCSNPNCTFAHEFSSRIKNTTQYLNQLADTSPATDITQTSFYEDEEKEDKDKCVICFVKKTTIVLIPCGHAKFCNDCGERLLRMKQQCPICRETIERINKFYH